MKRMSFDEVMSSKEYTLVMDGTAPIGAATYRHNVTGEVVLVVMNEEVFNMAQNTVNTQATNNTANNMEGNTMMNATNNNAAVNNNTNNTKEAKKSMKKRIGFVGNMIIAGALGASKGTGYGIGYAKETVKDEACYYGKKVKDAVAGTKMAQNFVEGYHNGENDAREAFNCRVGEREFRAEQKKNNQKNLEAATDELMKEFENFDDSVCGDGVWCAQ